MGVLAPRGTDRLVLQEFRLADGASHADVERILAAAHPSEVPLLTSIADDRDVASVRVVPSGAATGTSAVDRDRLGALVSDWGDPRSYLPRVAERSLTTPSHYRLAVTESGLNDSDVPVPGSHRPAVSAASDPPTPVSLLWIGAPSQSHGGLLVLVGDDEIDTRADAAWPLQLSQMLGVRIYRGSAGD